MGRKLPIIFVLIFAVCAAVYIAFIQKPELPRYLQSFFRLSQKPLANLAVPKPPEEIKLSVPILMYHYVENVTDERDTLRRSMATRPVFFEEQLRFLKNAGYTTITTGDLYRALAGKVKIPEKSVILTFDDGYRDFYTDAFPLLKKYKMKAINYIIVNHIGRLGNLTEQQIAEMLESGLVEIGCHSLNHDYLPQDTKARARKEIFDCKSQLESRFGVSVTSFSYPGGYYNSDVVKLVSEAGFATAVSTVPGTAHTISDVFTLKRLRTGNLDMAVFAKHILGPKAE